MLRDLDLTLEHDEKVDVPVAFCEQDLAIVKVTHVAAELEGGDILGPERRERDVSVGSHIRNLDPSDPIGDRVRELVQIAPEDGRPYMGVRTTRDDGTDFAVYAATATASLRAR